MPITPVLLERLACCRDPLGRASPHLDLALQRESVDGKSDWSGRYDWDIAAPATHLVTPCSCAQSVGLQGAGAANPAHNQASSKQ